MIQRIQSVYLLLAALCSAGLIFVFPLFRTPEKAIMVMGDPLYTGLFLGSGALSLIAIFLFRSRQNQVVVNRLNIILNFVTFGFIVYNYVEIGLAKNYQPTPGTFIPIATIIFIILANRAIMKDEALVRSADRLR